MLMLVVIIILFFIMFGSIPTWPYSTNWGYGPSGGIGLLILIIICILLLRGGL